MKKILLFVSLIMAIIVLGACGNSQDQKVYDEAYQALNIVAGIDGEHDSVIASFNVTTSLRGGVSATWESSNTTYASIVVNVDDATINITRPTFENGDVTLTLTATLTYNNITGTKEFSITILKEPEGILDMSISEVKSSEVTYGLTSSESTSALDGETVRLTDVYVCGVDSDAYFIYDGTTAIMVYDAPGDTIQIGQKGTLLAEVDIYYGSYQLMNGSWSNVTTGHSITANSLDLEDYWVEASATVQQLVDTKNSLTLASYVTFQAKIVYRADFTGGANYMLTLVDPTSLTDDENFVLSYYKSPLHDDLMAYDGLTITIKAVVRELRDARATNATIGTRPIFSLSIQEIDATLSDEQKVSVDKNLLDIETDFRDAGTLTLPTTGEYLSAITWAFEDSKDPNNAYVNLTTGAITTPAFSQVKVTIVATLTLGAVTDTKSFELSIGEYPIKAINEVYGDADGVIVRVKGLFIGMSSSSACFIQDATGGLALYIPSGDLRTQFAAYTPGIELDITGELDIYNGLYQIRNFTASDVSVTNSTPATLPAAIDLTLLEFNNDTLDDFKAQIINLTGFILESTITASSGSFNFYLVNPINAKRIQCRLDGTNSNYATILTALKTYAGGDSINLTGAVLGWYNAPQISIIGNVFSAGTAYTANQILSYVESKLILPENDDEVTADLVLPTTGLFETTISWQSSNSSVISTTGVVVRPASGQPNVNVTLTYTITDGTNELINTLNLIVLALPLEETKATDLFISEYIEGSSSNKAIEIYNGTGEAVDLSNYAIHVYRNGEATITYTLVLSGILADKDVYVITNASAALSGITSVSDITSDVTYFNGNDAVVLAKYDSGTSTWNNLDVIGVIGEDPGINWVCGIGATSEFSLVRASTISSPNTTWTTAEWVVYPQDTASYLGTHTMN